MFFRSFDDPWELDEIDLKLLGAGSETLTRLKPGVARKIQIDYCPHHPPEKQPLPVLNLERSERQPIESVLQEIL